MNIWSTALPFSLVVLVYTKVYPIFGAIFGAITGAIFGAFGKRGGGFFLKTKVFHFWKSRNDFNEMMSIELCLEWIFMIEDKRIISKDYNKYYLYWI